MGEYADQMLEGESCELCGVYLRYNHGSPQKCNSCKTEERREERKQQYKKKPKKDKE